MSELETVTQITTPLGLAGLALLLGSGILKAVTQKRATAASRLMIRWGFILAIVLVALANISYLATAGMGREIRVAGTVRDAAGRGVAFVIVDVAGRGRGISQDNGAFELTIPDSRKADVYELVFTREGYEPMRRQLQGPRPAATIDVTLNRQVLELGTVIGPVGTVTIRHYLGAPQILVMLPLGNPTGRRIEIRDVEVSVVDPAGTPHALPIATGTDQNGRAHILGLGAPVTVEPEQTLKLDLVCSRVDPEVERLREVARRAYPDSDRLPGTAAPIYSAELVRELEAVMSAGMFWRAGEWQLAVTASVQGVRSQRTFRFRLLPAEIERMRALGRYYARGYGVHPAQLYPEFADATGSLNVRLE